MGLKNIITMVYVKESEAVGEDVMTEARGRSDARKGPYTRERRWPSEAKKDKKMDSPLKLPKDTSPANILILYLCCKLNICDRKPPPTTHFI